MSLMTNRAVLRLRSALRASGAIRIAAPFVTRRDYEQKFSEVLRQGIGGGDIVWDVGANIGHYALKFSDWVGPQGKVYAFEPSPSNLVRLNANCGQHSNVVVLSIGLSDTTRRARFEEGNDELGATARVVLTGAEGHRCHEVQLRSGDELLAGSEVQVPNAIKIDVEGHELEVLNGLDATLAVPFLRRLFIEVHFSILEQSKHADAPRLIETKLRHYGFKLAWTDSSHLHAFRL